MAFLISSADSLIFIDAVKHAAVVFLVEFGYHRWYNRKTNP